MMKTTLDFDGCKKKYRYQAGGYYSTGIPTLRLLLWALACVRFSSAVARSTRAVKMITNYE